MVAARNDRVVGKEVREKIEEHLEETSPMVVGKVPEVGGMFGSGDGSSAGVKYFHVVSQSHLQAYLLETEEAKQILEDLVLHYARVTRIQVLHYCFMDNHFHILIGVRKESMEVGRFVGAVKQQFTNRFKSFFNGEYRRRKRYRMPKMGSGSLWAGRYKKVEIGSAEQLRTCAVYIENNRVVVEGVGDCESYDQAVCRVLDVLQEYRYQSSGAYLMGRDREESCLTDGMDGVWADEAEVQEYWHRPVRELPSGWRKVWFKGLMPAILKETEASERRYGSNPVLDELGDCDEARCIAFGRMLAEAYCAKRGYRVGGEKVAA